MKRKEKMKKKRKEKIKKGTRPDPRLGDAATGGRLPKVAKQICIDYGSLCHVDTPRVNKDHIKHRQSFGM